MWEKYYQHLGIIFCGFMIFLADIFTISDGLACTFYILIVVWVAERRKRFVVIATSLSCILATCFTYLIAHGRGPEYEAIFRRLVSCAAIIAVTPVALNIVRVRNALLQQDVFLDMTNHPIIGRDATGTIDYWNGAAQRLYGWDRREAIGKNAAELLSSKFSEAESEVQHTLSRQGYWEGLVVNSGRNNERFTVLSKWFAGARGSDHSGVLEIDTDVTSLHRVSERLRSSEARFRSIFNTVRIGIWEQDYSNLITKIHALKGRGVVDLVAYCEEDPEFVDGCIQDIKMIDANYTAIQMLEADTAANFLDSFPEVVVPSLARNFGGVVAAIANGAASFTANTSLQTLRGRSLSVVMTVNFPPVVERMNSVFVSVIDDTARRNIQDSLSEAHKNLVHISQMTALGEMTATIAHQINHPLAAIIANSEACLRWMNRTIPDRHEAILAIEAVTQNGLAAENVVANIRSLGNHKPTPISPFSILDAIERICRLLQPELRKNNIRVKKDYPREITPVTGDSVQIEQVVLNLMTNAIESLSDFSYPREISIGVLMQGESHILVSIQDNGVGIDLEDIEKLFTPFFTTKKSGLGLGLSICRSIIRVHSGSLWATNGAEAGSNFYFTLPKYDPQAPTEDRTEGSGFGAI